MADPQNRPHESPAAAPLARRTPVSRTESIETEDPEVVDRVASLLGKWAEDTDES